MLHAFYLGPTRYQCSILLISLHTKDTLMIALSIVSTKLCMKKFYYEAVIVNPARMEIDIADGVVTLILSIMAKNKEEGMQEAQKIMLAEMKGNEHWMFKISPCSYRHAMKIMKTYIG